MKDPVDRAVRAIARRQPFALLWGQFSVTHLVMLGGMGILRLYQPMSAANFWLLVALSQVLRFAEESEPHEVVSLLNGFWDLVVPILLEHGGHANKFIGDGVLAVLGAPARLSDHAACAVEAALKIADRVQNQYEGRI